VIAEKDRDRHSLHYNRLARLSFLLVVKLCSLYQAMKAPKVRGEKPNIVSVISDKSMGEMNPITAIDSLFLPQ